MPAMPSSTLAHLYLLKRRTPFELTQTGTFPLGCIGPPSLRSPPPFQKQVQGPYPGVAHPTPSPRCSSQNIQRSSRPHGSHPTLTRPFALRATLAACMHRGHGTHFIYPLKRDNSGCYARNTITRVGGSEVEALIPQGSWPMQPMDPLRRQICAQQSPGLPPCTTAFPAMPPLTPSRGSHPPSPQPLSLPPLPTTTAKTASQTLSA